MSLIDNFINECDIALKTLSYKKNGTGREYPAKKGTEKLSKKEKTIFMLKYFFSYTYSQLFRSN